MRILMTTWRDGTHPAAGGAEVYTEQVVARWAAAGHEVTLLTAAVDGRPADEVLHGVRRIRQGGKLGVYRAARRWYQKEGRGRFDVIIDQVNTRPFFVHEWQPDAPVVAFYHQTCEEIWHHEMPWPLSTIGQRYLEPRWLARMAGVPSMAVSNSTRDALLRFGVKDITVVPEGLTLPGEVPAVPKEATPTLVHVSRLVTYKQADHVMEAVRLARRELPDLTLWFVGDGPMERTLRKQAPEGVEFLGYVSAEEKHERMARAHAIVMASTREGWGLVIAEAAALGTRAIAYDRPGLRDAVTAADGVLVPATPEALANWIVHTLPTWVAEPPAAVPGGGVEDWQTVADRVFDVVGAVVPAAGTHGEMVGASA
ncbi:MAG: glycosyltransferase family 4 protein [Acidimicrobiaceae bacterium]|nr:glycosyltransferase family 4 protein [Ilumatobacter sp.]MCB9382450.1 glycosyltransferase family 4 protein [Acidimicrobiaceae bacterium]MCO5329758.1 glycosyltransferase family 4 protein [Ilumatobacteraceae bacterium]